MNRAHTRRRLCFRLVPPVLVATGLLTLAGCARRPELAEVEGTVRLDGKPLDNAEVTFLPDPEKGNRGASASAYTDANGHYRLRCERANADGAMPGLHRVCVKDLKAVAAPPDRLAEPNAATEGKRALPPLPPRGQTSRVPPSYADAARTPLRDVAVKPGRQTLDFDIKGGTK